MLYVEKNDDTTTEIMIFDKVIHTDKKDFLSLIEAFTDSKKKTIIINFANTTFIDSAGLGMLILADQIVLNSKKILKLKSPNEYLKKTFDLMNFGSIFTIEQD
jgi:anti-anti-sigma factor